MLTYFRVHKGHSWLTHPLELLIGWKFTSKINDLRSSTNRSARLWIIKQELIYTVDTCTCFSVEQNIFWQNHFFKVVTVWWYKKSNQHVFLLGCQLYNSLGTGSQVWENFDHTGSGWSRAHPVSIAAWWPRISRSGGKVHITV